MSLRLTPALEAEVDAVSKKRGLSRNATIKHLLAAGIAAERGFTPELLKAASAALAKVPISEPATGTEILARREPKAKRGDAPFKSRLKGYWKAP